MHVLSKIDPCDHAVRLFGWVEWKAVVLTTLVFNTEQTSIPGFSATFSNALLSYATWDKPGVRCRSKAVKQRLIVFHTTMSAAGASIHADHSCMCLKSRGGPSRRGGWGRHRESTSTRKPLFAACAPMPAQTMSTAAVARMRVAAACSAHIRASCHAAMRSARGDWVGLLP